MKINVNKENNTVTLTGIGEKKKTIVLDIILTPDDSFPDANGRKVAILIAKGITIFTDENTFAEIGDGIDLICEVRKTYGVSVTRNK